MTEQCAHVQRGQDQTCLQAAGITDKFGYVSSANLLTSVFLCSFVSLNFVRVQKYTYSGRCCTSVLFGAGRCVIQA